MQFPTLNEIEAAAKVVYRDFQATPQYRWALLSERLGTDCWVKHENHTPVGAFKIRGGLTYFDGLRREGRLPAAVISAAHTARQRQVLGTLQNIVDIARAEALASPAILVVGEVVSASPMWLATAVTARTDAVALRSLA